MSEAQAPTGNTGYIINWPMLKIHYRTDPDAIAALLPPGITVGKEPNVNLPGGNKAAMASGSVR